MTSTTLIVNMTQQQFDDTFVIVLTFGVVFAIIFSIVNYFIKK